METPAAPREVKARAASGFREVRVERKESPPQRPRTQRWELGLGERRKQRLVQPRGAGSREVPSFRSCREPRSLRPPPRPQPRATRPAPLRKEAAPAPPRAAPTHWRKISFSKPELGTSVPLTVFYVDTGVGRP